MVRTDVLFFSLDSKNEKPFRGKNTERYYHVYMQKQKKKNRFKIHNRSGHVMIDEDEEPEDTMCRCHPKCRPL